MRCIVKYYSDCPEKERREEEEEEEACGGMAIIML